MRRIQRAVDKEELVKTLTTGDNPPFREIWRLLIFAAMGNAALMELYTSTA